MSAIFKTAPVPAIPSKRPAAVPPPSEPKRSRGWIWLVSALLVGGGTWIGYQTLTRRSTQSAAPVVAVRTAKVTSGAFQRVMRVSGETSAREYANLTGPMVRAGDFRSGMTILTLAKNGSWVNKGDVVATLDPGMLSDRIDDVKAQVYQAGLDVKRREAEQEVEKENLRQTLREDKSAMDKARLDASASEVRTDVERELLKLASEESEAKYKEAQFDMPQKEIGHKAELKVLDITAERQRRTYNRYAVTLSRYTIRAPMSGLAVMATTRKGGDMVQVQVGDEMSSGQPLMKIVNPKSMQVDANVNQSESMVLRIGQKVSVHLDAFPNLKFDGRIYSIGALAVGGWRQNYYIRNIPVRIAIEGSDPQLIPDLSASGDVIMEQSEKATLVPLNAIRTDEGRKFVEVRQPDGSFLRKQVQVGSVNNIRAVIVSGLTPGDEVRID